MSALLLVCSTSHPIVLSITASASRKSHAVFSQFPRCSVASPVCPKQIPLHLNIIRTDKGRWLVRIDSVLTSNDGDNMALQLVLEHVSEDESSTCRRLYALCSERNLHIPQERVIIADQIRHWLETTEGNGVLALEAEVVR